MSAAGVSVAILCAPPRARAAASAVALALARATNGPCALAAAVGVDAAAPFGGTVAARRAAASLRMSGRAAAARGRLVWLADRREVETDDAAGRAAALSAELRRAATAAGGSPTAIALPFARSDALDRVLAWHDALVVVHEPGMPPALLDRALASLAALGRPVAAMAPPSRLAATFAAAGLAAATDATGAVAQLGLVREVAG